MFCTCRNRPLVFLRYETVRCCIVPDSGVGAGIDSYYEYLLKAYILLGDDLFLQRFNIVSDVTRCNHSPAEIMECCYAFIMMEYNTQKVCSILILSLSYFLIMCVSSTMRL